MPVVVTGAVKDYPWGMIDGMVPWTGRGTGKAQAELWFGVHPAGPSPMLDGVSAATVLSPERVPLLVKILAAAHPLSIQVHPDLQRARAGFAAQPPGRRIYSDAAEKIEMIVAMTEFQALAGWREPLAAARILDSLGYAAHVQVAARESRWVQAAEMIMSGRPELGSWDPGRVRRALATDDRLEAAFIGDAAIAYPEDPGIGVAAILRYHRLQPGDALYVPSGVPHAYLRGVCLEVMTASDNVLRLGMTSKEVAVGEALAAVRGDRSASVLPGSGPIWPAGAPFRLDVRRHVRSALLTGRYRVVVAIDGPVHIAWEHESVDLDIGQAVLVADDEPTIGVSSEAMVAMVEAVPVADRGIGG